MNFLLWDIVCFVFVVLFVWKSKRGDNCSIVVCLAVLCASVWLMLYLSVQRFTFFLSSTFNLTSVACRDVQDRTVLMQPLLKTVAQETKLLRIFERICPYFWVLKSRFSTKTLVYKVFHCSLERNVEIKICYKSMDGKLEKKWIFSYIPKYLHYPL